MRESQINNKFSLLRRNAFILKRNGWCLKNRKDGLLTLKDIYSTLNWTRSVIVYFEWRLDSGSKTGRYHPTCSEFLLFPVPFSIHHVHVYVGFRVTFQNSFYVVGEVYRFHVSIGLGWCEDIWGVNRFFFSLRSVGACSKSWFSEVHKIFKTYHEITYFGRRAYSALPN